MDTNNDSRITEKDEYIVYHLKTRTYKGIMIMLHRDMLSEHVGDADEQQVKGCAICNPCNCPYAGHH